MNFSFQLIKERLESANLLVLKSSPLANLFLKEEIRIMMENSLLELNFFNYEMDAFEFFH